MAMDEITFQSNALERLLERFTTLVVESQNSDLSEEQREELQAKQMALLMTDIPRTRARLRVEREKLGKIRKAHANVPQLDIRNDGEVWLCTFQTYIIDTDVFWNTAPLLQGRGQSPKDARSDFWIAWRELCNRRHGRNMELREICRVEYQQLLKVAQGAGNG